MGIPFSPIAFDRILKEDLGMKHSPAKKNPLRALRRLPWWCWLFLAVCIALPVSILGGMLPVLAAVFGVGFCIRMAISSRLALWQKLLVCTLAVLTCWGLGWGCVWVMWVLM